MSEELQKSIDTVLQGTTSKTGIAIKLLAQLIDNYNLSAESVAKKRQKEVLEAINKMGIENAAFQKKTDDKFKNIEVVNFFAMHPKIFYLILACVLVLVGAGAENLLKSFI